MSSQRESVKVLQECIQLQLKKSADYQNPNSNIKQAMHYRRGVSSIHDMIAQKLLRAQSLIEPMENGEAREPNFESLEDTYKDLINYASFAVSYIRGKMEGQERGRDMFNRPLHEGIGQISHADIGSNPCDEVLLAMVPVATKEETLRVEYEPLGYDGGGSASGQVVDTEDDGFVTVVPTLLKHPKEKVKTIKLKPDKNASQEERIQAAYFREVANKGEVLKPRGVVNCSDNLQHTYVEKVVHDVVKDIGDRIEEEFQANFGRNSD